MKEIKSLTGIRGIAACMVMIGHLGLGNNKNSFYFKIPLIPRFLSNAYLSVDLFFIMSGFVLMMVYEQKWKHLSFLDLKVYMQKRFARIFPIYIVCCIIYALVQIGLSTFDYSLSEIISNILLIQTPLAHRSIDDVGWSLSTEWCTYFLFPFFVSLLFKIEKKNYLLFLLMFVFLGLWYVGHFYQIRSNQTLKWFDYAHNYIGIAAWCRTILAFLLGNITYKLSRFKGVSILSKYSILIALYFICLNVLFHDIRWLILISFPLLILTICKDSGFLAKIFSSRIIYKLGQWSYSIYLIHMLIISVFREYVYKEIKNTTFEHLAFPISLILSLTLVIFLSALSYRYIEVPARNKLNLIFNSQK